MMTFDLSVIRATLVHVGSWGAAYCITLLLFANNGGGYGYAIVNGWWFALYVGYIARVNLEACGPSAVLYVAYAIAIIFLKPDLFGHDLATSGFDLLVVLVILVRSLFFVSPILVNYGIRRLSS